MYTNIRCLHRATRKEDIMNIYKKLVGHHLIELGYNGIETLNLVVYYHRFIQFDYDNTARLPKKTAQKIHALYHIGCAKEHANK